MEKRTGIKIHLQTCDGEAGIGIWEACETRPLACRRQLAPVALLHGTLQCRIYLPAVAHEEHNNLLDLAVLLGDLLSEVAQIQARMMEVHPDVHHPPSHVDGQDDNCGA